ncbi:hypothetical protein CAC42_468 [Sphaceloma murrayae]|uniref:Uncharacterized protein n=1 Tax=Sphaceloma murrayae TaxID=2082308 RepID=A0A2K1R3L2_9PEZI|nr:hypothetical protein CAC42_468 [Sphaceloma murrayae]
MSDFAQTGAQQDDLFDDYVNGEESMQTRAPDDLFGDDFTPIVESDPAPTRSIPSAQDPTALRGRGGTPRGRGRGRGSGGAPIQPPRAQSVVPPSNKPAPNPLGESRHAPNPLGESRHAPPVPKEQEPAPPPVASPHEQVNEASSTGPSPAAPTEPRQTKPLAVRGDRSGTGGNARTKLTEEELAAKISAIQLKNASLEAAHARAQADADSFAQRENEASKRRQEERRDRQQMMGEREKNRQRKLKAQEGREWDSEKRDEDFADQRRGYGRGAHGGVSGTTLGRGGRPSTFDGPEDDGREYIYREDRGRGRGRGGRGGRGDSRMQQRPQGAPQKEDFPALSSKKVDQEANSKAISAPKLAFPKTQSDSKTKIADSGSTSMEANAKGSQSWADMVEESRS